MARNMMQSGQQVKAVPVPTQPVVVASADLTLGAELKAEHLKVLSFPAGQAPEGSFAQPQELVGRGLIVSVVKHEPILVKARLEGSGRGPAAGHPGRDARGVGAGQRSHRRRRLRAARHMST